MALVAVTQLFLVLANCVLCTETDRRQKKDTYFFRKYSS